MANGGEVVGVEGGACAWYGRLRRKDRARVWIGAMFLLASIATYVPILLSGANQQLRWITALPLTAAFVTPGQIMTC